MYKIKEKYYNHIVEIPRLGLRIYLNRELTAESIKLLIELGYEYLFDKIEEDNKEKKIKRKIIRG